MFLLSKSLVCDRDPVSVSWVYSLFNLFSGDGWSRLYVRNNISPTTPGDLHLFKRLHVVLGLNDPSGENLSTPFYGYVSVSTVSTVFSCVSLVLLFEEEGGHKEVTGDNCRIESQSTVSSLRDHSNRPVTSSLITNSPTYWPCQVIFSRKRIIQVGLPYGKGLKGFPWDTGTTPKKSQYFCTKPDGPRVPNKNQFKRESFGKINLPTESFC